jgi:hypothetical protein
VITSGAGQTAAPGYPIFVTGIPQRTLLRLGFCLAIAATFFFAFRAGHTARHFRGQNEPIRAWMSVPFIAHTRHVREEPLFRAIHVQPDPRDHRPLRDIARAENLPVAELIRDLDQAIASTPDGQAR